MITTNEIAIDDGWYQWCNGQIEFWREDEQGEVEAQINQHKKDLAEQKVKLEKLLDIHIDGAIGPDEYKTKKNKIVNTCMQIENKIDQIESEGNDWFELLDQSLKLSNEAHHKIKEKDFGRLQEILKITGLNPILSQQKLSINFSRPWIFFREALMLTDRCSSPKKLSFKKFCEILPKSGVDGARSSGSCDRAITTLSTRREAPSGASATSSREPLALASQSELSVIWGR